MSERRSTEPREGAAVFAAKSRLIAAALCGLTALLTCGCTELVHMGQISDREASWSVGGAVIEQQQPDGGWKRLGETDGGGRWWIMKDSIRGGGRIRITKPGYFTKYLRESEFMQENNVLMTPSDASSPEEEPDRPWPGNSNGPRGR